ncbi:MAG: topoisomerase DNA-binding C4 zinc finger domain-containing protein, partial [Clostridia bacterium]|nr:topoisomerase DNA-binding C4 zinc finger domain-containing protein [Clostridia bacterium]
CGGDIIKRRTKKGKTFFGCANYPACDFVSWDKPVPGKCPQCGGILVQRMGQNGPFIACGDRACGYIQRGKKEKE